MQTHGINVETDINFPIVAEVDDLQVMEAFDHQSESAVTQIDKDMEEELVEQLEDFETMRENLSDPDDDNNGDEHENEHEIEDFNSNNYELEKENDFSHKKEKSEKHSSRRPIFTRDGSRDNDFGIVGKGFNDGKKINMEEHVNPKGTEKSKKKVEN